MRLTILFFFLIKFTFGYSQFSVGDTKENVISGLKSTNTEFTESQLTDSTSRISVLYENQYQMIWMLDVNDKVFRQTLIPEMENGANEFVKLFNKDFVIISDVEWRNYENGRIYKIQLEFILDEPIFSITLSPSSR
ncbi:hypothetical protein [uncultured Arcticibacterium sp.]|uniref:hypothetical protein n=1 Tax=uncultured Arcticibacterium sp. TaxID=2173042 RepID=UPI0030FCD33F